MPSAAATLVVLAKGSVSKVRCRLKLKSSVSTVCGAKVCESVSVKF